MTVPSSAISIVIVLAIWAPNVQKAASRLSSFECLFAGTLAREELSRTGFSGQVAKPFNFVLYFYNAFKLFLLYLRNIDEKR
jgi:hypothetical protein